MKRALLVFALLALIIGLPFAFRPQSSQLAQAQDSLVIITPHNEAIRYEFTRAFADFYRARTGRTVQIDWRTPGGTSEIARILKGEYYNAFEHFWRADGRPWNGEVAGSFDNPRTQTEARRAFLASDVGIGIDLFFGGGAFDFIQQAEAGRLVDGGTQARHPEWFQENTLPQSVSGEPFYDQDGRWYGAVISSFGICYNTDSLKRLGIEEIPASWEALGRPEFFRQVALADPTKSGSVAKAFEMVIQQQMQLAGEEHLGEGWARGLAIIQSAAANARYFTDAASRVPIDVAQGDAAIGMCIDFYGRFQSEAVRVGDQPSRLQYFTPRGGSSVTVDPIALLRGAPNREVAKLFIDFVLSMEGQKLWNFKVGTPGGPTKYSLRRLPVRKELYAPEYLPLRSDPEVRPYEDAKYFTYHPAWTASLFKTLSFIVRVMCLDPQEEMTAAWLALQKAGFPPRALARFSDTSVVNYQTAREQIRPALSAANPLEQVRLARELTEHFRTQYREARRLAEEGQ